jgi:hypothetical protein
MDWTWGKCCTDGTVLGPLDFIGATSSQSINININYYENLNSFTYVNNVNGSIQNNYFNTSFTIERIPCTSKSLRYIRSYII